MLLARLTLGLLCSLGVQTLPKTRFGLFDDLSRLKYLKKIQAIIHTLLINILFLPWRFALFNVLVCKFDPEFVALRCHGAPGQFLRRNVPARPWAIASSWWLWFSRSGSEYWLQRRWRRSRVGVGQKSARLGAPGALRFACRSRRRPLLLQGQLSGARFGSRRLLLLLGGNKWLFGDTVVNHSLL